MCRLSPTSSKIGISYKIREFYEISKILKSHSNLTDGNYQTFNDKFLYAPGGGALDCNMMGRYPLFENLYILFRKKCAFQYPVSEFLDYKTIEKQ